MDSYHFCNHCHIWSSVIIGKKSVRSEISINAPVEKVWSVITNTSSYAEWNSVMLVLEGKIKEGIRSNINLHKKPIKL